MDIIFFELRAANKDCREKFTEIAKHLYKGTPIFQYACDYVNNSSSYKRSGRKLEIMEIRDFSIRVKLTSESKLEMASKSLVGFTRELLRIDSELFPEEDKRLFRLFKYQDTLFKNVQLDEEDMKTHDDGEMSDVEALKQCVEIFCAGTTFSKEEARVLTKVKEDIKKSILEYRKFKRLDSYYKKLGRK